MKHPNKEIMLQVLKLSKENKNTCAAFIVKDNKIISKDICHYSEYKKGQFIKSSAVYCTFMC